MIRFTVVRESRFINDFIIRWNLLPISLCNAALALSNEEENAKKKNACGYVCMKVLKSLRSSRKANAIQFAVCLSNMACEGDEPSYNKYTLHWTGIVNSVVGEYIHFCCSKQ